MRGMLNYYELLVLLYQAEISGLIPDIDIRSVGPEI